MILDQLEAFHAVVKHGGCERASASLHVSQPAISMRIKELEKQLGVKLLIRLGRRDQLTEAATAEAILDRWRNSQKHSGLEI